MQHPRLIGEHQIPARGREALFGLRRLASHVVGLAAHVNQGLRGALGGVLYFLVEESVDPSDLLDLLLMRAAQSLLLGGYLSAVGSDETTQLLRQVTVVFL
ncbi:hypothetical protein [Streptomyces qaidamensis]|uniref:hypothetical protein n=1 Tax=Streptomyces qaidamensis TaxID=1783515 RepID=UPI001F345ADC|nr:hypothetical protein [Streptomyces qaidamensis]